LILIFQIGEPRELPVEPLPNIPTPDTIPEEISKFALVLFILLIIALVVYKYKKNENLKIKNY